MLSRRSTIIDSGPCSYNVSHTLQKTMIEYPRVNMLLLDKDFRMRFTNAFWR